MNGKNQFAQIVVYECSYCKKIMRSRGGMLNHLKKCFKNPETKSCITCKYFENKNCIDGKPLTDFEEKVFSLEVDGTFEECFDYENGGCYKKLKQPYEHLYNVEAENFCNYTKRILSKLTTKCHMHKTKN